MLRDLLKFNYSLSGHDPETTRFVAGSFRTSQELKQATSALNRHQFVDEDLVQIIDPSQTSKEGAVNEDLARRLSTLLVGLGFSVQQAETYTGQIQQGHYLLVVRTGVERVREAANIMQQAQAKDVTPKRQQQAQEKGERRKSTREYLTS